MSDSEKTGAEHLAIAELEAVRQEIYDLYTEVCTRQGLWANAPIRTIQHFGHGAFSAWEIVDDKIADLGGERMDLGDD